MQNTSNTNFLELVSNSTLVLYEGEGEERVSAFCKTGTDGETTVVGLATNAKREEMEGLFEEDDVRPAFWYH